MSLAQPPLQERRDSPGLNLQFASNNPFRRAVSPSVPSPTLRQTPASAAARVPPPRPTSTNPFLDSAGPDYFPPPQQRPISPSKSGGMVATVSDRPPRPPPKQVPATSPFDDTVPQTDPTLNEVSMSERNRPTRRPPPPVTGLPRAGPPPPYGHRVTHSQEEKRPLGPAQQPMRTNIPGAVASPLKPENRMPRRNSDTSVMEAKEEIPKPKDRRARDPTSKDGKGRSGRRKPNREVDLIDKLDLTGIYGPGMFHHGGPFDACNPHRNRTGSKAAPMLAFAEGSKNNALGGSGPVNKHVDYDSYAGRMAEGFTDYNAALARAHDPNSLPKPSIDQSATQAFDPKGHHNRVHGQESAGLGTSTFFEGTPVPKSAMQRQEPEQIEVAGQGTGLQRKKSLAQRFRGMSKGRPGEGGRMASPEFGPETTAISSPSPLTTPTLGVQSAGGRTKVYEMNPFFTEGDSKGGDAIKIKTVAEPPVTGSASTSAAMVTTPPPVEESGVDIVRQRSRTNSSTKRGLVRRATNENEALSEGDAKPSGGGLLTRVKSLKGRKLKPAQ